MRRSQCLATWLFASHDRGGYRPADWWAADNQPSCRAPGWFDTSARVEIGIAAYRIRYIKPAVLGGYLTWVIMTTLAF